MSTGSEPPSVESVLEVKSVPLSIHDETTLAAARDLQKNAVAVGRDFCQSMLTVSLSAIGAYLALLKLLSPDDTPITNDSWLLLPVVFQSIAAIIFLAGFHTRRYSWSLMVPADITKVVTAVVRWRFWAGLIGSLTLIGSILLGVLMIWLRL